MSRHDCDMISTSAQEGKGKEREEGGKPDLEQMEPGLNLTSTPQSRACSLSALLSLTNLYKNQIFWEWFNHTKDNTTIYSVFFPHWYRRCCCLKVKSDSSRPWGISPSTSTSSSTSSHPVWDTVEWETGHGRRLQPSLINSQERKCRWLIF